MERFLIFFRKLTYLFIWFIPIALNAAPSFFSEYQTPSVAASGGVSVFKENSYESNYYNAAVTALVKRPLIGFSTIYSPSIQGYWSQIASPLSPGSLSLAYAHVKYFNTGDTLNRARFAYGKKYNDSFSAGLATVYSALKSRTVSEADVRGATFFAITPSFLYITQKKIMDYNDFSINNLYFFGSFQNKFSRKTFIPVPGLGGGSYLDFQQFRFSTTAEVIDTIEKGRIPFSLRFSAGWKRLNFYTGHQFNSRFADNPEYSMGMDYLFDIFNLKINVRYGVTYNRKSNFYHLLGTGIYFDYPDTKPPSVDIRINPSYISVSENSQKPYMEFLMSVKEESPLVNWKLTIMNANGNIVRTFQKDHRKKKSNLTIKDILFDFFSKDEYQYVPATIVWDGSGEIQTIEDVFKNNIFRVSLLKEGEYRYSFIAEDYYKNITNEISGTFVVDNTPPLVEIKNRSTFYLSNSEILNFTIDQKITDSSATSGTGEIIDERGNILKAFSWDNGDIPSRINWDARDEKGKNAPYGYYHYRVKVKDSAGNITTVVRKDIFSITPVGYSLEMSSTGFSPNEDQTYDTITFYPDIRVQGKNVRWYLYISRERYHNKIKSSEIVYSIDGEGVPDKKGYLWNGKNIHNDKYVPDGYYYVTLLRSASDAVFMERTLLVDTTSPKGRIIADSSTISPDNDGDDECIRFNIKGKDISQIDFFEMTIYEKSQSEGTERKFFRKWAGKQIPAEIYWEGTGENGVRSESAANYDVELLLSDEWGNKSRVVHKEIFSNIVTENRGDHLLIRLSDLSFDNNELNRKGMKRLKRLSRILRQYPDYRFRVEVHSDDAGDDEENLFNTEMRAAKVMKFLISHGISKESVDYQGYGEITPLAAEDEPYVQNKNERVVIILLP